TLGFFDDIIILPTALQHPSRFDETEQAWVWEYDTGGDKHDLFMDPGESIRFRVTAESFVETSPSGPDSSERASSDTTTEETKVPYTLTSLCEADGPLIQLELVDITLASRGENNVTINLDLRFKNTFNENDTTKLCCSK
ncbi:unnamed protein product, partial [Timema podura]|nr:unnamed protein product [Timema podura]